MKKVTSKIFILIAIIVLIEGIAFLAAGIILDTLWLMILGGVFLAAYVISGEFYLFKIIRQTHREKLERNEGDLKKTEIDMRETVNATSGLENYVNVRAHQFANISHGWAVATVPERIWLVFFMALVLSGLISIICLACLGYLLICAIVFGAQVVIICGTIIVAKCLEKQSLSEKNIDHSIPPQTATVIACSLHTQSTVSKGEMSRFEYENKYHTEQRMTTRILDVIYKLKIELNGKKATAFGRDFFNAGDEVVVYQNKKRKRIYIIAGQK